MSAEHIVVVEDDPDMRQLLEDELQTAGYAVVAVPGAREAIAVIESREVDAVVTDLLMPGMKGDELLARVRSFDATLPVVIMTAFGTIESAVESMRGGAYHYITKPFRIDELLTTLEGALDERRLRRGLAPAPGERGPHGLVAESVGMRRALELLERAASADAPVLIRGESGTGKELFARALHAASPRREQAFLAVNCSAIPETLLESQLFGHRRGAFTDARDDRAGLFQLADKGTLLLDEIGDMAPALQSKLLRVLQEREIHPLGASAPVPIDVRIVAATHRDLESLCETGEFRQDLYYRLNVIAVEIPPLAERQEDLLPLISHLLGKHGSRRGRKDVTVSREALEIMRQYRWPGNVRELENVIERALVLGRSGVITPGDLPPALKAPSGDTASKAIRSISDLEREEIVRALQSVRGNKAAAARLLGLDRKTLYRKLELYQLRGL